MVCVCVCYETTPIIINARTGIGEKQRRDTGLEMERLLSVSRELQDKVQQNESAAGELLRQCEELKEELKAMRQVRSLPAFSAVFFVCVCLSLAHYIHLSLSIYLHV